MRPENEALLVIDVQNDFCTGGALAVPDADEIVGPINGQLGVFQSKILTQDWHPNSHSSFASSHEKKAQFDVVEMAYGAQVLWQDHCIQGSHGAAFHPRLDADLADLIIRKGFRQHIDSYSAFFENDRETPTGLEGYLRNRGVDKLFLAGLATDFCVAYSAIDGKNLGFEVTVLTDLCRALDLNGSLNTMYKEMKASGVKFV